MEVIMKMPKMGESIVEAEIIQWLKKVGDHIQQDTPMLEVATDKVDTEIPAMYTGKIKKILVPQGKIVAIEAPIAVIEITTETTEDLPNLQPLPGEESVTLPIAVVPEKDPSVSPLVKSIAKAKQISTKTLQNIKGTGLKGRITKRDIDNYIQQENTHQATFQTPIADEIVVMDRMRKIIAERMVASKKIAPHVTSFVEADVTKIVAWKKKYQQKIQTQFQLHLTYTPFFIEAVVKAIQKYPLINASVDEEKIILKKDIHIGLAVALSNGNLVVPVIKNAHLKNLWALTQSVISLTTKARNNTLVSDDLTGATYTVSNIGSFGNIMGTPIILQPQVAILALGAIVKKPVVLEGPTGDSIGIRHRMILSHTYDHRIIDGMLGGLFAKQVAENLENFDGMAYGL